MSFFHGILCYESFLRAFTADSDGAYVIVGYTAAGNVSFCSKRSDVLVFIV